MGPERERVHPPFLSELVQREEVCVDVERIVAVGRVVLQVPLSGRLHVLARPPLWLALIIHHVKPNHLERNKQNQIRESCKIL